MTKEILIKYLSDTNTYRCAWSLDREDISFETMPSEFVEFAEKDLNNNFEHKYINALSNAKRALDCQADRLLKLFGYYEESQKKFWGFPKKIELIQQFKILAPRVLSKINKTRNLMEHQYIKPEASQVEDFIDIVSLFIASTDHYISNFIAKVDYINEVSPDYVDNYNEISLSVNKEKNVISWEYYRKNPTSNEVENLVFKVEKGGDFFIPIFRLHLKKLEIR
jgi:hypothetical protein